MGIGFVLFILAIAGAVVAGMFSLWWVLQRAQPRVLALSDRATDGQADLEIAGNDACAGSAQKRPLKFI
jgi:hypothetical protein